MLHITTSEVLSSDGATYAQRARHLQGAGKCLSSILIHASGYICDSSNGDMHGNCHKTHHVSHHVSSRDTSDSSAIASSVGSVTACWPALFTAVFRKLALCVSFLGQSGGASKPSEVSAARRQTCSSGSNAAKASSSISCDSGNDNCFSAMCSSAAHQAHP